jgi:hypothetical protein
MEGKYSINEVSIRECLQEIDDIIYANELFGIGSKLEVFHKYILWGKQYLILEKCRALKIGESYELSAYNAVVAFYEVQENINLYGTMDKFSEKLQKMGVFTIEPLDGKDFCKITRVGE